MSSMGTCQGVGMHKGWWLACACHGGPSWPVGISRRQRPRAYVHAVDQVVILTPMDMPQPVHALPVQAAVDGLVGHLVQREAASAPETMLWKAFCLCSCSSSVGQVSVPESRRLCMKAFHSVAVSALLMSGGAQMGRLTDASANCVAS